MRLERGPGALGSYIVSRSDGGELDDAQLEIWQARFDLRFIERVDAGSFEP